MKTGRYDEAIDAYSQAAAIKPQDSDIMYNRGVSKMKKGDFTALLMTISPR
jgi:Flp pilus assembly protein TadD